MGVNWSLVADMLAAGFILDRFIVLIQWLSKLMESKPADQKSEKPARLGVWDLVGFSV